MERIHSYSMSGLTSDGVWYSSESSDLTRNW